jgi:hypothetical protein
MLRGGRNSVRQKPGALLASDTSPEAERMQVALWRAMSPLEKARAVGRVSHAVRIPIFVAVS